ncbi:MAG: hypothetical protein HQM11_10100 [SAR324 cluster bacterium]|nr:hypothetical protein [SAR324 cluster bacterium]
MKKLNSNHFYIYNVNGSTYNIQFHLDTEPFVEKYIDDILKKTKLKIPQQYLVRTLFIHILNSQFKNRNIDDFIPLNSNFLNSWFGSSNRKLHSDFTKKFLEKDSYYQKGTKAFGYKIKKRIIHILNELRNKEPKPKPTKTPILKSEFVYGESENQFKVPKLIQNVINSFSKCYINLERLEEFETNLNDDVKNLEYLQYSIGEFKRHIYRQSFKKGYYKPAYILGGTGLSGRIFEKGTLPAQRIKKIIKKEIFYGDEYINIDIVRSQPTILLYYFIKYELKSEFFKHYVNNDSIINSWVSEGIPKQIIKSLIFYKLFSLYTGKMTLKNPVVTKAIYDETQELDVDINPQSILDVLNKKFEPLNEDIKRWKFHLKQNVTFNNNVFINSCGFPVNFENYEQKKRTLIYTASLLQSKEAEIIHKMIIEFTKQGVNVNSHEFDGCVLYVPEGMNDESLKKLINKTLENIDFEDKDMLLPMLRIERKPFV